ncbi:unnamed protein product [Parnassius mnemosyne]|uniref:MADF domain-containing protein n=1 Tax=Parnassius mnemosyne TaxID=213953 RepID=A0AAV1LMF2_9NEOP
MAKHFDTEYLIKLVEARPVIWDKTLITYRDRNLRAAAWRDICINLKEDFEDMEEKERQAFVKGVVNKWNQTRDSWLRSLNDKKSTKDSISTAKFVKRYVYHNQMLFLKKVVNPALTRESINEVYLPTFDDTEKDKVKEEVDNETFSSNQNEEIISDSDTQENFEDCIKNTRRSEVPMQKLNAMDKKMMSFINHQLKRKSNVVKEDRNLTFFRSLLPSLSSLNDDQTLEFQSGVIILLQNIKRKRYYRECSVQETDSN